MHCSIVPREVSVLAGFRAGLVSIPRVVMMGIGVGVGVGDGIGVAPGQS